LKTKKTYAVKGFEALEAGELLADHETSAEGRSQGIFRRGVERKGRTSTGEGKGVSVF